MFNLGGNSTHRHDQKLEVDMFYCNMNEIILSRLLILFSFMLYDCVKVNHYSWYHLPNKGLQI